jgi:spermidine dehydrogenase
MLEELEQGTLVAPMALMFSHPHNATSVNVAPMTNQGWHLCHGYGFGYDPTTDEVAWTSEWPVQERPWLRARQPFGRIAIANCDAANNAMAEASFSEAHRAVREVLGG